jgi:hypothetical protein
VERTSYVRKGAKIPKIFGVEHDPPNERSAEARPLTLVPKVRT